MTYLIDTHVILWAALEPEKLSPRAADLRTLVADYGFDIVTPQVAADEIKAAMGDDKKKKDGRLRCFVMSLDLANRLS
jgi:PIN domain nuclease of toxin-antitoxin system